MDYSAVLRRLHHRRWVELPKSSESHWTAEEIEAVANALNTKP